MLNLPADPHRLDGAGRAYHNQPLGVVQSLFDLLWKIATRGQLFLIAEYPPQPRTAARRTQCSGDGKGLDGTMQPFGDTPIWFDMAITDKDGEFACLEVFAIQYAVKSVAAVAPQPAKPETKPANGRALCRRAAIRHGGCYLVQGWRHARLAQSQPRPCRRRQRPPHRWSNGRSCRCSPARMLSLS